jgi:hypothetical protein
MTNINRTVTRATGSWVGGGFIIGTRVRFAAPWWRRAWWWLLRVTRIRRGAGYWTVTEVTPTTLEIGP